MKKNLTLLGLLISLLIVTYYVYEVGELREKNEEVQEKQLFRPDELGAMLSMSNVVVTLERQRGQFFTQDPKTLVDERKLDSVFEVLSGVRSMRILKDGQLNKKNNQLMFPEGDKYQLRFRFEKGELAFIFGDKLKFDQTFYLKVIWRPRQGPESVRTMIAEDVSAAKGMYNKENYHLSDRKYKRLLTILYLDAEFFYETRPFYDKTEKQLRRVSLMSQKQRPFTVNFMDLSTTPPPLKDEVPLKLSRIKEARSQWARLEADRVSPTSLITEDQNHLLKVLTSWSTKTGDEQQVEFSLYRSNNGEDFWLQREGEDKTYIFEKRPDVFFSALQDFWEKTPKLAGATKIIVREGREVDLKSLMDFFSQEARAVDFLDAWPKDQGTFLYSLSDSSGESVKFDVYRVQNELHLRDQKSGLVYRYFQLPDWGRKKEK